jgi:hypothetical protein
MMIAYGYLLATHVPAGLRSRRQRALGLALVSAQGFLIVTAYGLYYISGERFREWVSYAHALTGFLFPALLAWHIFSGARERKGRTASRG